VVIFTVIFDIAKDNIVISIDVLDISMDDIDIYHYI
jgi:hypothetical protein